MAIADAGHSLTQVSHPVHLSLSTTATNSFTPRLWLPRGRHRHRSGSQRTCPCQLLPYHYRGRLPMRDIRSRRFRIRYTYRCQQLLPTRSLHRICFGEKKKRVSIMTYLHQEVGGGEDSSESSIMIPRQSWRGEWRKPEGFSTITHTLVKWGKVGISTLGSVNQLSSQKGK